MRGLSLAWRGFLTVHFWFVTDAARLGEVRAGEARDNFNAVQELHRYRAFNESGIRLLMEGEDLPLVEPSSLTEAPHNHKDVQLPREWRSKLQIVKWLGAGTFGKVFKCKVLCEEGRDVYVSVKYIEEKSKLVRTEIGVLDEMKGYSDFCISAVGSVSHIEDRNGFWIMMPYMNHGDFHDFIKQCQKNPQCMNSGSKEGRRDFTKVDPAYTDAYILVLFHDIVAGTEALIKKTGRIHTDLKPANVMVNCQNHMCFAAVIDLGLACTMKPNGCHLGGTPVYMPPETFMQRVEALHLPPRDVWALGVILYQLVYNRNPPFFSNPQSMVYRYDVTKDPTIAGTRKVDFLIMQMLANDYKKRPALATIRKELEFLIEEAAAPPITGPTFKIGDAVEYFSSSYLQWLPATITAVKDSSHYDLNIKPDAPVERLRPGQLHADALAELRVLRDVGETDEAHSIPYEKGDRVEWWSKKYQTWLPTKIMFARPDGTYLTDVARIATKEELRWPVETTTTVSTTMTMTETVPIEVKMLRSNAVQRGAALKMPSCL
ncbi:ULK1 [Symbiodinium sp. CCMP2592]|nr:ULK1 [Symbiodinium sp. CCMP2592]